MEWRERSGRERGGGRREESRVRGGKSWERIREKVASILVCVKLSDIECKRQHSGGLRIESAWVLGISK